MLTHGSSFIGLPPTVILSSVVSISEKESSGLYIHKLFVSIYRRILCGQQQCQHNCCHFNPQHYWSGHLVNRWPWPWPLLVVASPMLFLKAALLLYVRHTHGSFSSHASASDPVLLHRCLMASGSTDRFNYLRTGELPAQAACTASLSPVRMRIDLY